MVADMDEEASRLAEATGEGIEAGVEAMLRIKNE